MEGQDSDVVVPVIKEEVHADTLPVETGSVRVTKHVQGHEEILEQELRKGRVEVKRVKTERLVDGPQVPYKSGSTLVVPVVSEVLRVEKQWVVTEEIHITQLEERERVQQKVTVNEEQVEVERLNAQGEVISTVGASPAASDLRPARRSIVSRPEQGEAAAPGSHRVLSSKRSILRDRLNEPDKR